jgi:hypothetical protein
MPLTLISHLWNEEFLLPYWLGHHYPLFDRGVLLDYGSTDRSLEIIRELAAGWEVRPSRNGYFDARDADAEVMEVEREFSGWKVVLNTTEFLLCHDLSLYVRWMEKYRPDVQGVWAFDLVMVDRPGERDRGVTAAPLYFQKHWGYHRTGSHSRSRLLHRFPDGRYHGGRHSTPLVERVVDDGLFLLWFGWSPMRYVTDRKLQIQQRMSARDRAEGLGKQHLVTPEGLEAAYQQEAARAQDLLQAYPAYKELIEALARKQGITL